MPHKPNNENPQPATADDGDLRALFERTAPADSPVDLNLLMAAVARQRSTRPPSRLGWAMAAAAAMMVSVGGGWWAGRQSATSQVARMETALADSRLQITQDIAQLIEATQMVMAETREDEIKRVALLLRDDYRLRIAALGEELELLTMAVNSPGPGAGNSLNLP